MRAIPLCAALACGVGPRVLAPPGARAQSSPTTLETIVVTATRTERAALDVPASIDVIGRDEVRDAQWRINLSESLARVPDVVALNRQNYAHERRRSSPNWAVN